MQSPSLPGRLYALRAEASGLPQNRSRPDYPLGTLAGALDAEPQAFDMNAFVRQIPYSGHQSSVVTLPPEILSYIFKLCAETERPLPPYNLSALRAFEEEDASEVLDAGENLDAGGEFDEPSWIVGRRGSLGFIELSHVCRRWRNVMLGYSALWTDDIGALPDALPTILERAGSTLPLTVRLYGATYRRDNTLIWHMLSDDDGALARRVKILYWIETRSGYLRRNLAAWLPMYPFTALEKLVIWANEYLDERENAHLPVLNTPCLRVADYSNVACVSTSTSLTELKLRTTWSSPRWDVDVFVPWGIQRRHLQSILQAHSQTLLHLYLDVQASEEVLSSDEAPMEFPHLQRMYIHDRSLGSENPASVLSSISYSPSVLTYIHLEQGEFWQEIPGLTNLFSLLWPAGTAAHYGLAIVEEPIPIDEEHDFSILLRFYAEPAVDITAPVHATDVALFGGGTHRLTLKLDYDEHLTVEDLLQALPECIPAESVRTLSFTSAGLCGGCRIENYEIVKYFSGIHTLHLGDPHIGGIVPALGQLGSATFIPELERLWLTRSSTGNGHILSRRALLEQLRSRYQDTSHSRGGIGLGLPTRLKELRVCKSVVVDNLERHLGLLMTGIQNIVDILDWRTDFLPIH